MGVTEDQRPAGASVGRHTNVTFMNLSYSHVNLALICPPVLVWQPESESEVGAGGEGTSGVKRGLSLESGAAGQDVKRFRTATGPASTVSLIHSARFSCCIFILFFSLMATSPV